jgi:hypothetical protein
VQEVAEAAAAAEEEEEEEEEEENKCNRATKRENQQNRLRPGAVYTEWVALCTICGPIAIAECTLINHGYTGCTRRTAHRHAWWMVLHDLHCLGCECVRVVGAIFTVCGQLVPPEINAPTALKIVKAFPFAYRRHLWEGGGGRTKRHE